MTDKQKQYLLGYLGYYAGVPDGIWGRLSREATRAFQRAYNLEPDGVFGPATESLVRLADQVREHFGAPALPSSGVRCHAHNKAVGGVCVATMNGATAVNFISRFIAWLTDAVREYGDVVSSQAAWREKINALEAELETPIDE